MKEHRVKKTALKKAVAAVLAMVFALVPVVASGAGEPDGPDPVFIRVTLHEAKPEGVPVQVAAHLGQHVWRGARHRFGLTRDGGVIPFPTSVHANMRWGELDAPDRMLAAGQATGWADITGLIRDEHDWYRFNFAFNTPGTTARDQAGDVDYRRFGGNLEAVSATIDFAVAPADEHIRHSVTYTSDDYSVVPLLVRDNQSPRLADFSIITNYDYLRGFLAVLEEAGITASAMPGRFPVTGKFSTAPGSGLRADRRTARAVALYQQRSGLNLPDGIPERYLAAFREEGMFPAFTPRPVKVRDEPSIPTPPRIAADPERLARFRAWLEAEGVDPAGLGFESYAEVVPIAREAVEGAAAPSSARKLYWYSVWGGQVQGLEDLRELSRRRKAEAGEAIETSMSAYYAGFNRTPCYFLESRMGAMDRQNHHYGGGWSGMTRKRTHMALLQAPLFRSAAGFGQTGTGVLTFINRLAHSEHGSAESGVRLNIYTALIHGMKFLYHYGIGPRYTGHCSFAGDRGEAARVKMRTLAETMGELAQFEDYLLDGVSPHDQAEAAMLHSRGTEIWATGADRRHSVVNKGYGGILTERRMLAVALALNQVPFDIIPEEEIAGRLAGYRVLYVVDPWVLREAQEAIVAWVKGGGVLFTTGLAGRYDQFADETDLLGRLAGAAAVFDTVETGENYTEEHWFGGDIHRIEPLGRARWQLGGDDAADFSSALFAVRQEINVPGARVLARCEESGAVLAVEFGFGQGRVIHVGTHLGAVLARSAVPGFAERTVYYHREFDAALYRVYLHPLERAGVTRRLVFSAPGFDANFFETGDGAALLIADYHTAAERVVDIRAVFSRPYTACRTLDGQEIVLEHRDGVTLLRAVPVGVTRALLLE